jgi:hypothetical protein
MKILAALPLVAALAAACPLVAHAEDEGTNPAKIKAFDTQVFGGPIGKKATACFVRRYDANHLAQHRKQKVSSMKLVLTAENKPKEETSFAYKVGVQFKNKPGNFDGGSNCGHMEEEDGNKEIRFTCDVDCGGGGIEIAMAKDNKSAIVHLEVIGVYDRKHPKRDAITLEGGARDKVFRLDRVDNSECAELMPGHKEVALLQRK